MICKLTYIVNRTLSTISIKEPAPMEKPGEWWLNDVLQSDTSVYNGLFGEEHTATFSYKGRDNLLSLVSSLPSLLIAHNYQSYPESSWWLL